MIDLDEIRKEVAVKHGLLLDKDDPVLVTVTLNEIALARFVDILNAQNAAALDKAVATSQKIGEKIIAQGADYVSKQAKEAVTSALNEGLTKIEKAGLKKEAESSVFSQDFLYGAAAMGGVSLILVLSMITFLG